MTRHRPSHPAPRDREESLFAPSQERAATSPLGCEVNALLANRAHRLRWIKPGLGPVLHWAWTAFFAVTALGATEGDYGSAYLVGFLAFFAWEGIGKTPIRIQKLRGTAQLDHPPSRSIGRHQQDTHDTTR